MSIALDRLSRLPAVFKLHDLTKTTYLNESLPIWTAKKFIARMAMKGFIKPAGPRTACYYNLIADKDAPRNRVLEVVHRVYPEAVVIGTNVLHAYGWITQIPRTIDLAVSSSRRSLAQIHGVELHQRPTEWFSEMQNQQAILRLGESPFLLDSLTPRAALDDIRKYRDTWVPDADDLFIPDDEEEGVQRLEPLFRPRF